MKLIWAVLILIFILAYEKVWRPIVCKEKIHSYINNLGGKVDDIEKLTLRDEIYNVNYTVSSQSKRSIVKFSLFYKDEWE